MNGAEALLETARRAGLDVCFANPGTTEMQLVGALDAVAGIRPVLCLFEGVCTGAADGHARFSGKPAFTILHLGPGFANGIANLHNARRAHSPIVNLVGDHATWHVAADAPLTSDIESLARPVGWIRTSTSTSTLAADLRDAIEAARTPPGRPATLVVPQDLAWEPSPGPLESAPPPRRPEVDDAVVGDAAGALRGGDAVLLIGGDALRERGLRAAARIAAATGCRVLHETFVVHLERGGDLPVFDRLPYFPEMARDALAGARTLVLAGTPAPVAFFGYPGQPSTTVPEGTDVRVLATPAEDATTALEALADLLSAPPAEVASRTALEPPTTGSLDVETLGATLAALQPEDAIVIDEAATSGFGWFPLAGHAKRHAVTMLTGGAIGQGLPCAVGAAVACPDRKVIAFQADGSGMYTLQSLWTMARENLDVTVVLCSNRKYHILDVELARAGITEPGPKARSLTDLSGPPLDWTSLGRGMGVESARVDTLEALAPTLRDAIAAEGPRLVEVALG